MRLMTLSACLLLGSSSLALAQGYNGVVPGSGKVPEHIAAQPGGEPVVTWPGFQVTEGGGSRVFVQTTVEVKPELKQEGSTWVVIIPTVGLPKGNTRLPLDTHFFNTPVKNARLKPRPGGGVLLILEMKAGMKVRPEIRTERAPSGYYFVYAEFPAGNYR